MEIQSWYNNISYRNFFTDILEALKQFRFWICPLLVQLTWLKALSHGAIFHATCDAVLFLRDVNLWQMFGVLKFFSKLWLKLVFANFTSTKGRIALQVARKIASCDRALKALLHHAISAQLFTQVASEIARCNMPHNRKVSQHFYLGSIARSGIRFYFSYYCTLRIF